jgi:hypothetical protein
MLAGQVSTCIPTRHRRRRYFRTTELVSLNIFPRCKNRTPSTIRTELSKVDVPTPTSAAPTSSARYWKTPSVVDEKSPSGRLRCPTLGEVECHTSVPKSNVDRWAKEEEKILRGRAEARVNRSAKGPPAKDPKRRPKDDPLWDVVARDHALGKR